MDNNLIALKLFLDELGIPVEVETINKRKIIQKAVYLGQLSGVDLGYRYSWDIMGPYCSALSRDYYALNEALKRGESQFTELQLVPDVRKKLDKIKNLLTVPSDISLEKENWMELISSIHFLEKVSKLNWAQIVNTIKKEKNHIADYSENARSMLNEQKLL